MLFFLLLFASINAFAINQKDVNLTQSEQLNVSSKVEKFYIDETGNLPAEEIFKKDFTNVKNELKNSSNGNIWRKITISNKYTDSLLVQLNIRLYSKTKFDSEIYLVKENNKEIYMKKLVKLKFNRNEKKVNYYVLYT